MSNRTRHVEVDVMRRGENHEHLPAHRMPILPGGIASRQADMIEALLPMPRSAVTYRQPRPRLLPRLADAAVEGILAYKGLLITPLIGALMQAAGGLAHYSAHHTLFGGLALTIGSLFGAGTAIASIAHITNETPPHQIATERAGHSGKIIATAFGFTLLAADLGAAALAGPFAGISWGTTVVATIAGAGALGAVIHEENINRYARETHRIGEVADLALASRTVQGLPPTPPMDGLGVHPIGQQVVWALSRCGVHRAALDGAPTVLDARRWTATVNHPGVPARRVIGLMDDLAATLQVVNGGLRITRGANEHQTVWSVNNTPLAEIAPTDAHPITELEASSALSLWDGIHFGDDDSDQPVILRLLGRSGIFIAGAPGSGKSNAVAAITCTVISAHDAELWTIDGAGRELAMFDPVARYSSRFDIDEAIDMLCLLRDEMIRRSEILAQIGETEFTKQLAHEHGVKAIAYVIGELSHYSADDTNQKAKRKFNSLLADITPRGRANAMVAVLDSQKPEDKLIPSAIRDQIALKLALKCETEDQIDTILGRGYRKLCPATMLPLAPDGTSLGFGYLKGVPGREPFRIRTRRISAEERKAVIAARAGQASDGPPDGPGGGIHDAVPSPASPIWQGTHLRPVSSPRYPDGTRVDDNYVAFWSALDRFPEGFAYNEAGALASDLGILNGRSGVQRPLDNWGRSGYLVKIGVRSGGPGQAPSVWRKVTAEEYAARQRRAG